MNQRHYIVAGALFGLCVGSLGGMANGDLGLIIFAGVGAMVGFAIVPIRASRARTKIHEDDNG